MSFTAQLSTSPDHDGRRATRADVVLGAGLRQRGAHAVTVQVVDLSVTGFRAATHLELMSGADIWLKLPGLEFAYMIDEHEVLVQLKRTTNDQNQPRFRRPRLFGESMSQQEKQLARLWGASVGIAIPGE